MEAAIPDTDRMRYIRLSGLVALLVLVAGLGWGVKVVADSRRDHAQAGAYATEAVIAMARAWDPAELAKRAAPEWLGPADLAALPATFRHFSALGRLHALQAPVGRVGNGIVPGTRIDGPWADYGIRGDFDQGPALFSLLLKRVDGGWQIAAMRIDAEVFHRAGTAPSDSASRGTSAKR
jgi:hypothetical protein